MVYTFRAYAKLSMALVFIFITFTLDPVMGQNPLLLGTGPVRCLDYHSLPSLGFLKPTHSSTSLNRKENVWVWWSLITWAGIQILAHDL